MELRRRGAEDEFLDIPCQDISPPTRKQPVDVVQELELVHFLLTELNQREDKRAPVKELRGCLMVSFNC